MRNKPNKAVIRKQTEEWLLRIVETFLEEADETDENCKEDLMILKNRLEIQQQALEVLKDVISGKKHFTGYKEYSKPKITDLIQSDNIIRRLRKK